MKQLTINDLFKLCRQEIAKGNGDRRIYTADDDEGNGYHGIYYAFTEFSQEDCENSYGLEDENAKEIIILD